MVIIRNIGKINGKKLLIRLQVRKRNLEAANAAKRARRNDSRGNIHSIIGHNEALNEPVISEKAVLMFGV